MVHHKIVHYKDRDVTISGELKNGRYFLHCEVEKYSHNIQKRIDIVFGTMLSAAKEVGFPDKFYAALKNTKYAELMGGKYIGDHLSESNELVGVYVWEVC